MRWAPIPNGPRLDILVGTRAELAAMPDDPSPLESGTRGTVRGIQVLAPGLAAGTGESWAQLSVDWDNGRSLMLCVPPDRFHVVEDESSSE